MSSFGSCKTRFEFLSQFRKVRNAFECFVTQVQTRLPKTKRVWPMKINVICTVCATCNIFDTSIKPSDSVWIYIYITKFCLLMHDLVAMVTRLHYDATRFLKFGIHILKIDKISFQVV